MVKSLKTISESASVNVMNNNITSDAPLTLSIEGLSYAVHVKNKMKTLLKDVSVTVHSGDVLIIMGPSGAGKTTLLSNLTQRSRHKNSKQSTQSGRCTLNDVPLWQVMNTHCCFVEQFSQTWAFLTPREVLRYASKFYCSEVPTAEKREKHLLESMGLHECADTRCGNEFFVGLSGGQKKRLVVSEALVKEPLVVFMDEPTTGLDSAAADNIMDLIFRTARETNTIFVLTLHQPSTQLFLKFEHVLMLTKGETAYYGTGLDLSGFCEKQLASPVPYAVNPCDHFLHLINPDFVGDIKVTECIDKWKLSKAAPQKSDDTESPCSNRTAEGRISIPSPPPGASLSRKTSLLLRRQALLILRDPMLYTGRMVFYFISNMFFAVVYIGVRQKIQNQVFPRLLIMMWFVSVPCNLAIVTVYAQSKEMELVKKEVRSGMYSAPLYLGVNTLLQIPMLLILTVCAMAIPGYAVVSMRLDGFAEMMLIVFCILISFEATAQFNSLVHRNPLLGMMVFLNWWFASFLFCGFLINPEDVIWPLRVFSYIVPFTWGIRGMAAVEFTDVQFEGAQLDNSSQGYSCPASSHSMGCYGVTGRQILDSLNVTYRVVQSDANVATCVALLLAVASIFKLGFFGLTMWRVK